jgi:hypothetical protein
MLGFSRVGEGKEGVILKVSFFSGTYSVQFDDGTKLSTI